MDRDSTRVHVEDKDPSTSLPVHLDRDNIAEAVRGAAILFPDRQLDAAGLIELGHYAEGIAAWGTRSGDPYWYELGEAVLAPDLHDLRDALGLQYLPDEAIAKGAPVNSWVGAFTAFMSNPTSGDVAAELREATRVLSTARARSIAELFSIARIIAVIGEYGRVSRAHGRARPEAREAFERFIGMLAMVDNANVGAALEHLVHKAVAEDLSWDQALVLKALQEAGQAWRSMLAADVEALEP